MVVPITKLVLIKCHSFKYKGGALLIHDYTVHSFIYSLDTDIANIADRSKPLTLSLILCISLAINAVD